MQHKEGLAKATTPLIFSRFKHALLWRENKGAVYNGC